MRHRGRARGARAIRHVAILAGVWLSTCAGEVTAAGDDAHASGPAAGAETAPLTGTLAYGKSGLIRLVIDPARLTGADPRLRLTLVNEGSERFHIDYRDAWIVVLRDGSKVAFAPRTDMPIEKEIKEKKKGEDEPLSRADIEPLGTLRLMLAPPTPMEGEVTSVELRGSDPEQTLLAAAPYRRARRRLVTPIAVPAGLKAPIEGASVSFGVVVDAAGKAESITALQTESLVHVTGGKELAPFAKTAISGWTFDPALRAGRPERSLLRVDVRASNHRVQRRVFAVPEAALASSVAAYLRATFPFFIEIPDAHGFAVAGPLPEGQKGTISARAWFLRTGEDGGRTWVAVASRTLTARDPDNGIKCGCALITDSEDASLRLLDKITERLGLPAVENATLLPLDGLIPSGFLEPFETGAWRSAAVSRLLRAALVRADEIRKAGATPEEKASELGKTVSSPDLPGASEFSYRKEDVVVMAYGVVRDADVPAPKLIKKTTPEYPEAARRLRIEGNVLLRARIDEAGNVRELEVLRGIQGLDASALDAVACWKYEPVRRDGKAVPVDSTIAVTYELRGGY